MVLLSGGVDSVTLAAHGRAAGYELTACHVNYGQPAHREEREAAAAWCAVHDVPLYAYAVVGLPLGDMGEARGAQVVPGRNALLVSLAASAAVQAGANVVWIGATADDCADYADCRPAWVDAMSAAARLATGVRVDAPFSGYTKRDVLRRARELGVDLAAAWSCYQPVAGRPCGTCASCQARQWAEGA